VNTKFHDAEFDLEILGSLRKREILGDANPSLLVPLWYNLDTKAESLDEQFQRERRDNPLLETTPPEAWLAAILLPDIEKIRPNVRISDRVLSKAVQRYLLQRFPLKPAELAADADQTLTTAVTPFIPAVRSLLADLFDRKKSLMRILALRLKDGSIHETIVSAQPTSDREKITAQAIRENWPNIQLAQELNDAGLKPRNPRWTSYIDFLHQDPGQFYVLRSSVKRKYFVKAKRPERIA
jgi:hypothetical protein